MEGRKGCLRALISSSSNIRQSRMNRCWAILPRIGNLLLSTRSPTRSALDLLGAAGSNETPKLLIVFVGNAPRQFDYLLQSPGIQTDLKTALQRVAGLVEQSVYVFNGSREEINSRNSVFKSFRRDIKFQGCEKGGQCHFIQPERTMEWIPLDPRYELFAAS